MRERRRPVLPLLAFVLCLFGLVYEPGGPVALAAPVPAAAQATLHAGAAQQPLHETGHDPAFLANHAQAAAPGDGPAPPAALPPDAFTLDVPCGPLVRRPSAHPVSGDPHARIRRARAPPASAGS
ncbi:hypothetical protein [Actinomadura sp. 9N407]|uniref:hypothetical protein n=1 Tax=Actinomadura sp. 9N407 TaxID=3375154 RepID=UPI0037BC7AD3